MKEIFIYSLIQKFLSFLRWKDWAMGKITLLSSICFYIFLVYDMLLVKYMILYFIFILFASVNSIYGYLINDLFDRKIDRLQKKKNSFEKFNNFQIFLVFSVLAVLMLLFSLVFIKNDWFLSLWAVQLFISTFYSAPPIRLKERGIVGLLAAFIAQFLIPVAILFAAFGKFGTIDMFFFIFISTLCGFTLELGHQKADIDNDAETSTKTYAVKKGKKSIAEIYGFFLQMDRLAVGAMIIVMMVRIPALKNSFIGINISPILPLLILYVFLYCKILFRSEKGRRKDNEDPYFGNKRGVLNIMHVLLPSFITPLYLGIILSIFYPYYIGMFFFLFFLIMLRRIVTRPNENITTTAKNLLKGSKN